MAFEYAVGPIPGRTSGGRYGAARAAGAPQRARRGTMSVRARVPACPELDCLRDRLPPAAIAAVERRAVEAGVGAERVLIAAGILEEESYVRLLARSLGLAFEPLDRLDRRSCPLDDRRLLEAAKTGLLPFLIEGELVFVVAPRSARRFVEYVALHPHVRFRLTSTARLDRFIAEHGREALGRKAAFAFDTTWPQLSAASSSRRLRVALAASVALVAAAFVGFPDVVLEAFTASLSAYFLIWLGLRNLGSLLEPSPPPPAARGDRDLPTYTVIAALYREADAVDLFLPGLARMHLPLPLGGSSNHFRTEVLRAVGAWDAYNVTEDADLGMRLARFGYRSTVIDSATYEEAPARFGPWLRQRTRWFKGWAQTWAVHMRTPIRLLRELGLGGFLTFQLVVGGNVLAALIHPIFFGLLVYAIATRQFFLGANGAPAALASLYLASLVAGYLTSIVLGLRALARRGLLASARTLVLVPLHWLLLSLAAWRALLQLARDPHGWEKTEHGLAKSSRRAKTMSAAALDAVFHRELADRPEQTGRAA